MKSEFIICSCQNTEHLIRLIYDTEDNLVYADIHLKKVSFVRRIIYALKYIFGYQSKYGAFDEFIFSKEHTQALKKTIDTLNYINE